MDVLSGRCGYVLWSIWDFFHLLLLWTTTYIVLLHNTAVLFLYGWTTATNSCKLIYLTVNWTYLYFVMWNIVHIFHIVLYFLCRDRQQTWGWHPEWLREWTGPSICEPPPCPWGAPKSSTWPLGRIRRHRRKQRYGEREQSNQLSHGLYDWVLRRRKPTQASVIFFFPDCTLVGNRSWRGRTVSTASLSPQSVQHFHLCCLRFR